MIRRVRLVNFKRFLDRTFAARLVPSGETPPEPETGSRLSSQPLHELCPRLLVVPGFNDPLGNLRLFPVPG